MGFFKDIKSRFNEYYEGLTIVEEWERKFRFVSKNNPNVDQYEILGAGWQTMMEKNGKSMLATMGELHVSLFSCLPSPVSARAMGLAILHIIKPNIASKYPKFSTELLSLESETFLGRRWPSRREFFFRLSSLK